MATRTSSTVLGPAGASSSSLGMLPSAADSEPLGGSGPGSVAGRQPKGECRAEEEDGEEEEGGVGVGVGEGEGEEGE